VIKLDTALQSIADKLATGERLSRADGITLFTSPHLAQVGQLAGGVQERLHGRRVSYIINRHINQTNICALRCPLCAFSRSLDEDGAYCLSIDEVVAAAETYRAHHPSEFHIVGGLHPDLPFTYAESLLAALHTRFPDVALKAFTAVEIDYWATRAGLSVTDCLRVLQHAGLAGLTGGGAEIFSSRVRRLIAPKKIDGDRWCAIHGVAHALGIPTTATMLYGHVETLEERVDHLLALRAQQDNSGGFVAFVPLAYHPTHTALGGIATTGRDHLQTIAVARLLLDNIPHIKAYWVMLGVQVAQAALLFGANDLDGTVMEERICHDAGGMTPQALSEYALRNLIKDAGRKPVRRDSQHRVMNPHTS